MKEDTLNKLEKQFEEFPFMKSEPVSEIELEEAEKKLGVRFVPEYKEFVKKYGGAIVGPYPIYGLRQADPMDDELWSVTSVTMHYRNEGWPEVEGLYIISSDHADNPVGIAANGKVVSYDHDLRQTIHVADSFEEYLLQCLGDQ